MKISIKPFKDYYEKFGEVNIDMKSFKKRYKQFVIKIIKLFIIIIVKKKIILLIIFAIIVI